MFRDFFPNATIYGAEIDEKRIFKEDRIEVINFDQGSVQDINALVYLLEDVDIVIDDGSHMRYDQLFTCYGMMPFLKKGAVYVIEDVAHEDILVSFPKEWDCKLVRVGKRYDDQLIIIRK